MENILKEPKAKVTLKLGETEYILPPFNLNLMVAIEETFGSMQDMVKGLDGKQMSTTLKLLTILLAEYNLTPKQIGETVTLENMSYVSQKIIESIGG
jgi:hypothetical protein